MAETLKQEPLRPDQEIPHTTLTLYPQVRQAQKEKFTPSKLMDLYYQELTKQAVVLADPEDWSCLACQIFSALRDCGWVKSTQLKDGSFEEIVVNPFE